MGLNTALVAFMGDCLACAMYQTGFLFQKLSHSHLEKKQLQMRDMATTAGESRASQAYCSWRFLFGFSLCCLGTVVHIFVLPYLDLVLMACNSLTSVLVAQLLSTTVLGEKFVCKYDFTGMLLLVVGCGTIVYNANTKQDEYTIAQAIAILIAPQTLIAVVFSVVFLLGTIWYLRYFTSKLRIFEKEADSYDAC